MKLNFEMDGKHKEIIIQNNGKQKQEFEIELNGTKKKFIVKKIWARNFIVLDEDNKVYDVFVDRAGDGRCIFFKGKGFYTKTIDKKSKRGGFDVQGEALVKSPLPGIIKNIEKNVGDTVDTGEGILFLEAMKMENEIKSPKNGVIKKIFVNVSSAVNSGDKLFLIE